MIAIVDYDAGNIKSVEKALVSLGQDVCVTRERDVILQAEKVILPGVGSFGDAMERIRSFHLEDVIKEVIYNKSPFLGICLGLQLLFERSDESPGVKGLSILEGEVVRIPAGEGLKIPHIGWNSLEYPNKGRLYKGIEQGAYVYFVHSYYLRTKDKSIVTATTEYGTLIEASVEKDNVFACQFHPEKSSEVGLKILKNFVELNGEVE